MNQVHCMRCGANRTNTMSGSHRYCGAYRGRNKHGEKQWCNSFQFKSVRKG